MKGLGLHQEDLRPEFAVLLNLKAKGKPLALKYQRVNKGLNSASGNAEKNFDSQNKLPVYPRTLLVDQEHETIISS